MNSAPAQTSPPASNAGARWREIVTAELAGTPYDKKLVTRTVEGIDLQPVYTSADLAGLWPHTALPGEAPFLRGSQAPAEGVPPWEIAQEIPAATPRELNHAILAALRGGQRSLVLRPCGPRACPPFLPDLAALRESLAGVNRQAVPLHCDAGSDPAPWAALLLAHAADQGFPSHRLAGSITGDPFAEWVATGGLTLSLDTRYDGLAGWTAHAAVEAPQLRTIGIDVTVWSDAGATAVHELAFALAAGAESFRALRQRGLAAAVIAPRFRIRCAIGPQFFMEVAKFRALRALWAQVMSAFGSSRCPPLVHAVTGRWNKSKLDTPVNLLRATTEGLSAVLGGVDSLHLAPFDEVAGTADPLAQRIARNVQVMLAEEFGFGRSVDPAGGSWYVEKLTDELGRAAWSQFQELERMGGFAAALRQGHPQVLVAATAGERKRAVATRRVGLVGTNLFPNLREKSAPAAAPVTPPAAGPMPCPQPQLEGASWAERFTATLAGAHAGLPVTNLTWLASCPGVAEVRIQPVLPQRAALPFEQLRSLAAQLAARQGRPLQVFLARIGPPAQHQARAGFSAGFFATGGFEAVARESFSDAATAASAAAASGAPIAVLCSTDETYPQLVPTFAAALKTARRETLVVVAGQPATPELAALYRAAGVDEFIHVRTDLPATLTSFLETLAARP